VPCRERCALPHFVRSPDPSCRALPGGHSIERSLVAKQARLDLTGILVGSPPGCHPAVERRLVLHDRYIGRVSARVAQEIDRPCISEGRVPAAVKMACGADRGAHAPESQLEWRAVTPSASKVCFAERVSKTYLCRLSLRPICR